MCLCPKLKVYRPSKQHTLGRYTALYRDIQVSICCVSVMRTGRDMRNFKWEDTK